MSSDANNGMMIEDQTRTLLQAYEAALARTSPITQELLTQDAALSGRSSRRERTLHALVRVPFVRGAISWLVRQFVSSHVFGALGAIKRGLYKRTSLEVEHRDADAALSRIESYEKSVPPVPVKRSLSLALVAAFGLAFLVFRYVLQSKPYSHSLIKMLVAFLTNDHKSLIAAVQPQEAVGAIFIVGGSLWAILSLPVWAFRLKGVVLLNEVSPTESSLCRALGVALPVEVPFDLVGRLLALVVAICVATILAVFGFLVQRVGIGAFHGGWESVPFYSIAAAVGLVVGLDLVELAGATIKRFRTRGDGPGPRTVAGSPSPVGRAKRRVRIATTAGAMAGLATILGATATVQGPRPHLQVLKVDGYARFQRYVSETGLHSNFDPAQLDSLGYIVLFQVRVEAPANERFVSRWSVHDAFAADGKPVPCDSGEHLRYSVSSGPVFSIAAPPHQTAIDRSSLFLVDTEALRHLLRGSDAIFTSRSRVWVPLADLPPDTPLFIRIELLSGSGDVAARTCDYGISPLVD